MSSLSSGVRVKILHSRFVPLYILVRKYSISCSSFERSSSQEDIISYDAIVWSWKQNFVFSSRLYSSLYASSKYDFQKVLSTTREQASSQGRLRSQNHLGICTSNIEIRKSAFSGWEKNLSIAENATSLLPRSASWLIYRDKIGSGISYPQRKEDLTKSIHCKSSHAWGSKIRISEYDDWWVFPKVCRVYHLMVVSTSSDIYRA